MKKSVLIARPHPFVVSTMRPFLEEIGFAVTKLERLGDLAAQVHRPAGVIISLAVSSSIPESAEEVFVQLRSISNRTPVLFASLLDVDMAVSSLKKIALHHGGAASVISVKSPSSEWAGLGKQETFLYASKEDIEAQDRRAILSQMVRRHFHQ